MTSPTTPDKQALGDAYQSLRDRLLGWLVVKVNDHAVAEDLLHDVFKKALIASEQKGLPENIDAWLFTITRNTVIDFYRAKRPMDELPDDLQSDDEDSHAHQLFALCMLPMVNQLPEIYRDAIIAVDFEGNNLQRVADAQEVSLSAIKSRVSRGRLLLKNLLLDCCEIETLSSGEVVNFHHNGRRLTKLKKHTPKQTHTHCDSACKK